MDDPGSPPAISLKAFPGPRDEREEQGESLPSPELGRTALLRGDCLVCLHEVVCLCVEMTVLPMLAAGTRGPRKTRKPRAGVWAAEVLTAVMAGIASEGAGPVPGTIVTEGLDL